MVYANIQCHVYCMFVGMDEIHCGRHSLTFKSGLTTASVDIPVANDNIPECDEIFTAQIILTEGHRLGVIPSTSIRIRDEGNVDATLSYIGNYIHGCNAIVNHTMSYLLCTPNQTSHKCCLF